MPTDFAALDALSPLPPQELPRQWLLTRDRGVAPDGWPLRTLGGWHLAAHGDAHVCDLRAEDGTRIGWVIEPLALLEGSGGSLPRGEVRLPVPADVSPQDVETALYGRDRRGRSGARGLEGTWTAIVLGPEAGGGRAPLQRVYLGPTHSVMYSPEQRVVATTHNLFPEVRRDEALSRAFDPLATKSYFTFGLTAFHGIRRLLPNHHLDLADFSAERHWPREAPEPFADGREGAAAVVDHGRRLVAALAQAHREFVVFLSAGRDSRAVLSMLRPFLHGSDPLDVRLATTVGPDMGRRTDLQAARRLARISGLPLDVQQRQAHDAELPQVLRAFVRIGEAMSGPILSSPGLSAPGRSRDGRFKLAGMGGEVGRAFYWRPGRGGRRLADREVTPEIVVERTRSPRTPAVLSAAERWLGSLPPDVRGCAGTVLDLAYVEQRLGCWQAPSRYLFPGRPRVASPMATGHAIASMLRLPEPYRAAGVLQHDMVAHGWPELLQVPFNEPTGLLGMRRRAQRLPRRAARAGRRLARRGG